MGRATRDPARRADPLLLRAAGRRDGGDPACGDAPRRAGRGGPARRAGRRPRPDRRAGVRQLLVSAGRRHVRPGRIRTISRPTANTACASAPTRSCWSGGGPRSIQARGLLPCLRALPEACRDPPTDLREVPCASRATPRPMGRGHRPARHSGERGHRRAGRRDRQHGPRFRRHAATTRAASAARRCASSPSTSGRCRLKALATYLMERKEEFYELSKATGATRTDAWIDIEGGIGTLFAYASKGRRELPNSHVLSRRPARGAVAGRQLRAASTSACRWRAPRSTSTPSTFPAGACWRRWRRPARRGAGDRQAGEPDGLPDRADVPPDDRVRHLARGRAAADLRRHRRPVRPPDRTGRRHLHRLGRHRPAAASSIRR